MSAIGRAIGGFLGLALVVLSVFGGGLSLIAIVDPAGTQMANDSDPSGVPPPASESFAIFGVCVAIGVVGIALVLLACRRAAPGDLTAIQLSASSDAADGGKLFD